MAWITLRYFSEVLGMQRELYAIVPQKNKAGEIGLSDNRTDLRGKCLYLLHGLSDDHTIWMRRTSIERYAEAYGLTVVMPNGDVSFYTDMKHGRKYYTHIAQEIPRIAQEFLHVTGRREDSFIAGLSMGGYGALKIGLRESHAFRACAALSPVTDLHFLSAYDDLYDAILGANCPIPAQDDLFALASQHQNDTQKPDIYLTIGTEDALYPSAVRFRDVMRKLPYQFEWRDGHGSHSWDYWDAEIQNVMAWMTALS